MKIKIEKSKPGPAGIDLVQPRPDSPEKRAKIDILKRLENDIDNSNDFELSPETYQKKITQIEKLRNEISQMN